MNTEATQYIVVEITKYQLVRPIYLRDDQNNKHITGSLEMAQKTINHIQECFPHKQYKIASM